MTLIHGWAAASTMGQHLIWTESEPKGHTSPLHVLIARPLTRRLISLEVLDKFPEVSIRSYH